MTRWRAGVVAVLLPTAVNLAIVAHGYDGAPYLRGDCPYYYAVAVSLVRDHDLDLGNQVPPSARNDNVAVSKDGHVVPKHPILMSIASAPFVAAMGPLGALVFNLCQFAAALWLMFALAQQVCTPALAAVAVVVTYGASFLPAYAWNYSPDLFASMLLAAATVAATIADDGASLVGGGVLMGLACAAKYPLLLFAPGTLLLVGHRRGYALTAAWAVGLALPLAGVAWLNLHLFGSIWLTGHDRILTFGADGLPGVYSQRSSFGDPLVPGMMGQLLDRQHGLLMTSPITILSLIGLLPLARARFALGAHLLTSAAALFVFYAGYRLWPASHYGNRFLMPVVVLAVLPLAALLQAVATKLSGFTSPDPRARTSP